jgi:putative DNA primase/helicase
LCKRYVANDCTYEALGSILVDNPNGVLAFRDELVSLLKTLDREDNASARGFFLSAWNGTSGYTFDRIVRGRQRIDAACLSMLGSTQPGRIQEYIGRAVKGGAADDGLVQRFGLLVWPDMTGEWREADRYPNTDAKNVAHAAFDNLDRLDPLAIGAQQDQFDPLPFLRFDAAALETFSGWRKGLEDKLRSGDLHPALESHLAKYRKLVPALALISHLADGGTDAVGLDATLRALAWADNLESHARRAYGAAVQADTIPAKLILKHIRAGDLPDEFTARDVYRPRWAGLADSDDVQAGLDLLADCDWPFAENITTEGRPRRSIGSIRGLGHEQLPRPVESSSWRKAPTLGTAKTEKSPPRRGKAATLTTDKTDKSPFCQFWQHSG